MAEPLTVPGAGPIARILREAHGRELRAAATAQSPAATAVGVLLLAASLAGTYDVAARDGSRHIDALACVLLLWCGARVTQAALSEGGATLALDTLRVLPIPVSRLAVALLRSALTEPDLIAILFACGSLALAGAHSGVVAALSGAVSAALLTVLTAIASLLVRHALPATARRGRDLATLIGAAGLALLAGMSAAYPLLAASLTASGDGVIPTLARVTPAGWAANAVHASLHGRWPVVAVWWAALVAAIVAGAALWPWALRRRLQDRAVPNLRGGAAVRRHWLPAGRDWAVVGKELRLWARDPLRITFLMLAAVIGVTPAVVSAIDGDLRLLPCAGMLSTVIACGCATNLYGAELDSSWATLTVPGAARADVRGRQLAWLLVVGPYALVISLGCGAVAAPASEWPWILGILPALLGAGAGIVVLGSLHWVLGLDDTGGPTPAWSMKIHAGVLAAATPALAPLILLLAGTLTHTAALRWAAVPVGLLIGSLGYQLLGRRAIRRLEHTAGELRPTRA